MAGAYPVRVATPCGPRIETAVHSPSESDIEFRDDPRMGSSAGDPAAYSNTVRIGYARVSGRTQDHQLQLDALAAADCRDIVIETASTRTDRPKLRQALAVLKPGDTLVIYKPERVRPLDERTPRAAGGPTARP